MENREPGFYWVKYDWNLFGRVPVWVVAEWCTSHLGSGEYYWHMPGVSCKDEHLAAINETRILPPDETDLSNP